MSAYKIYHYFMHQMDTTIRQAKLKDLEAIIQLLSDDELGRHRESGELGPQYTSAFKMIDQDEKNELVVMEVEDRLIGTLQLTFLPYLTYHGGLRAQIEAVRIARSHRGRGLGKELIQWAIDLSKLRGAHIVQLTSDKKRPEAIEFYKSMGFNETHEGMKLKFN